MDTLQDASSPSVSLTAAAAARIRALIAGEPGTNAETTMLRLSVTGGGCAGFSYHFNIESELADDDRLFERDGVRLVVDTTSLDLLAGSEVDYVETLMGASFQIKNPLAKTSCGCGTSFSV